MGRFCKCCKLLISLPFLLIPLKKYYLLDLPSQKNNINNLLFRTEKKNVFRYFKDLNIRISHCLNKVKKKRKLYWLRFIKFETTLPLNLKKMVLITSFLFKKSCFWLRFVSFIYLFIVNYVLLLFSMHYYYIIFKEMTCFKI